MARFKFNQSNAHQWYQVRTCHRHLLTCRISQVLVQWSCPSPGPVLVLVVLVWVLVLVVVVLVLVVLVVLV